jgi:hypothetical protein
MPNHNIVGETFVLYGCKAWTDPDNSETTISGLFKVEDICLSDPTCGQWEHGYCVFPAELAGQSDVEGPMYFVDAETFLEQTDPQSYGRLKVQEREDEWAEQRAEEDQMYADLFDCEVSSGGIPF